MKFFDSLFVNRCAERFLKKHGFYRKMITDEILLDMDKAAERKLTGEKGGQDMFSTWMKIPEKTPVNENVIVIDAGGTNFRSCLVSFDNEGKSEITCFRKTSMPATDREYSKEEFFNAIADRIEYLRDKACKIGFCFSYALEITKNLDGIPNAFSKEIKAKEVLGVPVGKTLVEVLEKRGWKKIEKIVLLNDTVSALLAGVAANKDNVPYSSYVGFILGTGMNGAFIDEYNKMGGGRQIIVCESGKCKEIALSDFDISLDKKLDVPGQYPLEKCCSGAYLGKVCLEILETAAREGLFSGEDASLILSLKSFSTVQTGDFLNEYAGIKDCGENGSVLGGMLKSKRDRKLAFILIDSVVDRCAYYAASILASCLLKCGKGTEECKPVCIVCNGTTLYKTYRLKERMEKYLKEFAENHGLFFKTVCIEDDITLGTAVGALVEKSCE